jgi:phosphoglycerate dehydrogenase-like enzyme
MAAEHFTIWCDGSFPSNTMQTLRRSVEPHRLVFPATVSGSILKTSGPDPLLETADIAFGQPDPDQILRSTRLKWIQLTTAGYTRYDRDDIRAALQGRSAALTNSSSVYDEPCAQHLLAMMLALARQLPQCVEAQRADRSWQSDKFRGRSHLLGGQTALIMGFGAIGRRVAKLLAPLGMNLVVMRRSPKGDEPGKTIRPEEIETLLPDCDHVLDILPDNASTKKFMGRGRFERMNPSAIFYNIGRGTTVDQDALAAALFEHRIAAAYLDVTDPEPLPPSHPLWSAPNCYITPHIAGGHANEFDRLVKHFLDNLKLFEAGTPLNDRVI